MKSKILMILVFIGLMFSSSFAVNTFDSLNNQEDIEDIFSDVEYLRVATYTDLVFYNSTYDLQDGMNFHPESNSILYYVVSNNNDFNQEFNFITIYKDGNQTYAKANNLNISGGSSEQVIVQASRDYEYISTEIYCVSDSATCGAGYQIRSEILIEDQQGIDSAFTPLIKGVVDLITINLTMWRAVFYLFIFSVVAGIIVGVFRGAFWLMEKSRELNNKDGFMSENAHVKHKEER